MEISITDKYLFIMVNSACIPSRIILIQRIHAPIIQYLPSLMKLTGKERYQYTSIHTKINFARI